MVGVGSCFIYGAIRKHYDFNIHTNPLKVPVHQMHKMTQTKQHIKTQHNNINKHITTHKQHTNNTNNKSNEHKKHKRNKTTVGRPAAAGEARPAKAPSGRPAGR